MATLVKQKLEPISTGVVDISLSIPTPFPVHQLGQEHDTDLEPRLSHPQSIDSDRNAVLDLMPSITSVEDSCLTTLGAVLGVRTSFTPDRRHSMPTTPIASTELDSEPCSALLTLVANLRSKGASSTQEYIPQDPIQELNILVERASLSLDPADAQLAKTLTSLISHLHRLSVIHESKPLVVLYPDWLSTTPTDPFDTLKRHVSDFQIERQNSQGQDMSPSGSTPVTAVESALLWTRIDEELENIVSMCKSRTDSSSLPPQYDFEEEYDFDILPTYEARRRLSIHDAKANTVQSLSPTTTINEKMRLEFEAITRAIDHLYLVAPQLHNQRVELKSSKVAQMQKASLQGNSTKGKGKERDLQELDNIVELIGKASSRSLKDQSFIISGDPLERVRRRDAAKKQAFVDQLAEHSNSGRFHQQDAVFHPLRTKNPEALLSLPEFIRESIPSSMNELDSGTMLTLPEFVREHPIPPPIPSAPAMKASASVSPASWSRMKSKTKNRSRAMSAPSISWLRTQSRSRSGTTTPDEPSAKYLSRSHSPVNARFEVHYVAENQENLQHILVFFTVSGGTPGVDLVAEVLPSTSSNSHNGDCLVITSGNQLSVPLNLPGHASPGKKNIRAQNSHFEIKLSTSPNKQSSLMASSNTSVDAVPLLDAAQLISSKPTSFICTSCSLPLVQSGKVQEYRDLPSEHWEELVDAWMCHPDQTLHEQVSKHGRGFWPVKGQALVGGSYILFDGSAIMTQNIGPKDQSKKGDEWSLVRCICGAIIGRSRDHLRGDSTAVVHRLLKYAIRPISPTAMEPIKIPLSAYIVEDMTEFVRAHASYRFVIQDEEEEKPRILIWLFKPSLQLSYAMTKHYTNPKHATINAAKVLYKLIGPTEDTVDLNAILDKYPGFPQAEFLYYPMDICHQLAALLRESTSSYPEGLRTMTGLEVGWLRRA